MNTNLSLAEKQYQKHFEYWKDKVNIDPYHLESGEYHLPVTEKSFGSYSFFIGQEHCKLLDKYSGGKDLELFILLFSALGVLFSKYNNYQSIVVDTTLLVSGEKDEISDSMIPMIFEPDFAKDLKTYIKQVNNCVVEAYKHQHFPFYLLNKYGPESRQPLTNVLAYADRLHLEPGKGKLDNYDLIIKINKDAGNDLINLNITYNTYKFSDWFLKNVEGHFKNVLANFGHLDMLLEDIEVLSNAEINRLLHQFNNTLVDFPTEKTLVDVFEELVESVPDNTAVIFQNEKLSYQELNEKSNRLAQYLRKAGVMPGDYVGVMLEKSADSIIAFLGILKSGGAYLPIDPDYPRERSRFILRDANPKVLIIRSDSLTGLEDYQGELFAIDIQLDILEQPLSNLVRAHSIQDIAYIIYTSGTTGMPKGVMVPHSGVVNLAFDHIRELHITGRDNILQFFSLSFDASVLDIIMALLSGATLVMINKEMIRDTQLFITFIADHEVSVMTVTPSFLRTLHKDKLESLRIIITGGEEADTSDALFYADCKTFYNAYGPSEVTVNTTLHKVNKDFKYLKVPIGKPRSNKKVLILDNHLKLVPEGLTGEICVSGTGLANGYLNAEKLTNEKFVANPFSKAEKMYKTGDLGKWLPDGNIEFIGRKDGQVKIRGFRIELGEIETVLENNDRISKAVVIANEDEISKDKELVAFYTKSKRIEVVPSSGEYFIYDPFIYQSMATDEMRVKGYRGAVKDIVKNKVVLDPGTGSEMILSRHCIDAGARKVYGIEIARPAYDAAAENIKKLKLEDKMELIFGDISQVSLPDKIDFCISALAGNITSTDGCITIINNLKSHLKTPVTFIPNRYFTKIAAVNLPAAHYDLALSKISQYYVKEIFKKIGYKFDLRLCLRYFSAEHIVSTHGVFEYVEYSKDLEVEETRSVELIIEKDTEIHGLILWINALFNDHMVINSIEETHHLPVYFPVFPDGIDVKTGDAIVFNVHRSLSDDSLTTDFVLEGKVITESGETPFNYESFNSKKQFRKNKFYSRLFNEEGQSKLLQEISEKGLKKFIGTQLPEYMVPAKLIEIDEWPLTGNGKIDKKALAALLKSKELAAVPYYPPSTTIEKKLVALWQEVLEKDKIGIRDNFFDIGGHSLKATQLASRVNKEFEIKIGLEEIFNNSTIEKLSRLVIRSEKWGYSFISPVTKKEYYDVSHAQKRLWVLNQFKDGSKPYLIFGIFELLGELDKDLFEKALLALIDRHEILRTTFLTVEGEPKQKVHLLTGENCYITHHDLTVEKDKQAKIRQLATEALQAQFDLQKGPLLGLKLIELDNDVHLFLFTMHHIISDAWSMNILIKEFLILYEAFVNGKENPLQPLAIQYKDFAAWQISLTTEEALAKHKLYWHKKLAPELPLLSLPTDFARPSMATHKGGGLILNISKEDTFRVRKLSREREISLFMVCSAIIKILLYKLSNQRDIIIGCPISGRDHLDLENQVGFYLNILALRDEIDPDELLEVFFAKIKQTILEAYEHQFYPFDILVNEISLDRDVSRHPLFDVYMDFHNFVNQEADEQLRETSYSELTINAKDLEGMGTDRNNKYDLAFIFNERSDDIGMFIEYSADLFKASTIERIGAYFMNILKAMVALPGQTIGQINMITVEEQDKIINRFNNIPISNNISTVLSLIDKKTVELANEIALTSGDLNYTYRHLSVLSGRLANHFADTYHLNKGSLVGILLPPSDDLVIAILAILKAGYAFVPLDFSSPKVRNEDILNNSGIELLVTNSESLLYLDGFRGTVFAIDIQEEYRKKDADVKNVSIKGDDTAYVLFTSGSTGIPKGVEISHASLANYVECAVGKYFQNNKAHMALFTPASFDFTLTSIFAPLAAGGRIYAYHGLSIDETLKNIFSPSSGVDIAKLTPSHLTIVKSLKLTDTNIKTIIAGGEALKKSQVEAVRALNPLIKVFNEYGPTEATIGCVVEEIMNEDTILIGKPLRNTQIYIMDSGSTLLPIGVWGEIAIGGACLAKGYFNSDELTSKNFIPHPFITGERIYKTGDLARWKEDGKIEYLGRQAGSSQVKIRGYRIELVEIESVILKFPLVKDVKVLVETRAEDYKKIIAFIIADDELNMADIEYFLHESLPDYMVPAAFAQVIKFPLTARGKLDEQALLDFYTEDKKASIRMLPQNETEHIIAQVWSEALSLDKEQLDITDNFFALGGDSMRAVKIVYELNRLGLQLQLDDVFKYATIEHLANYLSAATSPANKRLPVPLHLADVPDIVKGSLPPEIVDVYPVSGMQEIMIAQYNMDANNDGIYHSQNCWHIRDERLSIPALVAAIDTLCKKQPLLRTTFIKASDDTLYQCVTASNDMNAVIDDISFLSPADQEAYIIKAMEQDIKDRFQLNKPDKPFSRFKIFLRSPVSFELLFSFHHAVIDGWGDIELQKDLLKYYLQVRETGEEPEVNVNQSYKEFIALVNETRNSEPAARFWEKQIKNHHPFFLQEKYEMAPASNSFDTFQALLQPAVTADLIAYAAREEVSLKSIFLLACLELVSSITGSRNVTIGVVSSGRSERLSDPFESLGLFWNIVPFVSKLGGSQSQKIKAVQAQLIDIENYSKFPLLDMIDEKDSSGLFFACMNFINFHNAESFKDYSDKQYPQILGFRGTEKYHLPLSFIIGKSPFEENQVSIRIEYNKKYFDQDDVAEMNNGLVRLLKERVYDKSISNSEVLS